MISFLTCSLRLISIGSPFGPILWFRFIMYNYLNEEEVVTTIPAHDAASLPLTKSDRIFPQF